MYVMGVGTGREGGKGRMTVFSLSKLGIQKEYVLVYVLPWFMRFHVLNAEL